MVRFRLEHASKPCLEALAMSLFIPRVTTFPNTLSAQSQFTQSELKLLH